MALADSVPGVSGGTIAFLLGFYDRFISSLDDLIHGKWSERIAAVKFLIQLGIGWLVGMGAAVMVLTQVFDSHIYAISSLFIGFILLAIPLVLHEEHATLQGHWKWCFFLPIGIVFVVGVSSVNATAGGVAQGAAGLLYVFVGGIIAISAMVLPGISGSTLLLIMGLYLPVITAVRAVMGFEMSAAPTVLAFVLGVCTGVALIIRLLRYLMEHRDTAVTRDTLLCDVWGYDYAGDTNIVDVYIRYLRQKIDEPFHIKTIHTIRAVGYMFSYEEK